MTLLALGALLLLAASTPSEAHMWLRTPLSRGGVNFAGGTSGPCSGRAAGSGTRTELEAGQKVVFQFRVNQHGPAPFKFALSSTSSDSFTTVIEDDIPNKVTAGADGFDGVNVEVTIPNTPCDECSIQLSGMGQVGGSGRWYNCADVKIVPAGSGNLPTTSAVQPSGGPVGGGTLVTVTGTRFGSAAPSPAPRCRFGLNEVEGTWVSSTQITCTSPPNNQPVDVPVDVSVGGGGFSTTGTLFKYAGAPILPEIEGVEPRSGEPGDVITITGRHFYSTAMLCRFNATTAEATVLSDTEATCTIPENISAPSNKVKVPFEVSVDGSPYSQSDIQFTLKNAGSSAGRISGGQAAGIAIGVILIVGAVGILVFLGIKGKLKFVAEATPTSWQKGRV